MTMTSRSSRRAPVRAAAKERVWGPTSRGVALQPLGRWPISKGSSMMMMWSVRVSLRQATSEGRVVVWPEPTGPVRRMRPLR